MNEILLLVTTVFYGYFDYSINISMKVKLFLHKENNLIFNKNNGEIENSNDPKLIQNDIYFKTASFIKISMYLFLVWCLFQYEVYQAFNLTLAFYIGTLLSKKSNIIDKMTSEGNDKFANKQTQYSIIYTLYFALYLVYTLIIKQ